MNVFKRLLMLSGGGESVPYDYPDKFAFFADQAIVEPSILEVLRPSDRLGDFTVVRGSSATYVDSDGIIKEAFQLGDELVTNGDFEDGETGWALGTGWSISGEEAHCSGGVNPLQQSISTEIGKSYQISIEILDISAGLIRVYLGGGPVEIDTVGVHVFIMVTENTNDLFLTSADFIGSIDNISVKEVSYDIARIDYTNGVAELLTEPQSTNLVTQSIDFSSPWLRANCTVNPDVELSPDGTSDTSHIALIASDGAALKFNDTSASGVHTMSIWVKRVELSNDDDFRMAYYNVTDDLVYSPTFTATDEWQRFEWTPSPTVGNNQWWFINNPTAVERDFLIWGAQLEELPYATSYIPTNGSTVTRLQDEITDGGNVNVINSQEGTMFFEGSALYNDGTDRRISLSNGLFDYTISIRYTAVADRIYYQVRLSGINQVLSSQPVPNAQETIKTAFTWKQNEFKIWTNGVEMGIDTLGDVFSANTLNKVSFDRGTVSDLFFGRTRELKVYNKALPDSQLEYITTL